jgi:hypothetical protein
MSFMRIPRKFLLSAEEIRHVRHTQLSQLTGIRANNFPKWDRGRRISEQTLERLALGLHTSKFEVLEGFELRRQDVAIALAAQAKADQLIILLGLDQEPA